MYFLFLDTLSSPAYICLFDRERKICDEYTWDARHAESDTLNESIQLLLNRNNIEYAQLLGIVCLVWPWSFTGARVTTLVANTLGFSFSIPLYSVTIDEFFRYQNSPLPWVMPLTRTEVLFWSQKEQIHPDIIKIDVLRPGEVYTSNQSQFFLNDTQCTQAQDYNLFLQHLPLTNTTHILHPVYARNPNILIKK